MNWCYINFMFLKFNSGGNNFLLSSNPGSSTCSFCTEDYYLKHTTVDLQTIFQEPCNNCLLCPSSGICPWNTTLLTIRIPPGYWRDSLNTTELYECKEYDSKKSSEMDLTKEGQDDIKDNLFVYSGIPQIVSFQQCRYLLPGQIWRPLMWGLSRRRVIFQLR